MNEYNFTVQQEGYIFVEADSLEEAEATRIHTSLLR